MELRHFYPMVKLHFLLMAILFLVTRNPPDCTILGNWIFDSLILMDELFAKDLKRFANCLLVKNNLCEKLVSLLELPIMSDDSVKITLV